MMKLEPDIPPRYPLSELVLGPGVMAIGPIPGRDGKYQSDLSAILRWTPAIVLTMNTSDELSRVGADTFGDDLKAAGVDWHHLPVPDFGAPPPSTENLWPLAASAAQNAITAKGRVFVHCYGGCGRSGMAILRLMVEAGEDPDVALARLRKARACAVETEEQFFWAAHPKSFPRGHEK